MTVAIHPTEARPHPTEARPASRSRGVLFAGFGLLALGAFAAGSFSFFSTLADPRAKPRSSLAAASWPELKDGVPALAETAPAGVPVQNLPRQRPSESERVANGPAVPVAPVASPAEPIRAQAARPAPEPAPALAPVAQAPALPARETKRTPPIENAATVAVTSKAVPLVAPRAVTAIAPARAETVKAKPAQPSRFVSLPSEGGRAEAPTQKPKPAAKVAAPAKPQAPKLVADAQPAPAVPSAAPDEPEVMGVKIPGGRQIRDGFKAVGSLFGGESDGQ